jgi:hypothetical protein
MDSTDEAKRDPTCICDDCPTMASNPEPERFTRFCQTGQTSHEMINQGCLCDVCPVGQESKDDRMFHCEA